MALHGLVYVYPRPPLAKNYDSRMGRPVIGSSDKARRESMLLYNHIPCASYTSQPATDDGRKSKINLLNYTHSTHGSMAFVTKRAEEHQPSSASGWLSSFLIADHGRTSSPLAPHDSQINLTCVCLHSSEAAASQQKLPSHARRE